jgi:hypothetical protein
MTEDEQYPERGYNTDDVEALRSSESPKKGWLCKTWEGEIAMVNLPGQVGADRFQFTVSDDSVAQLLNKAQGQRVALSYKQHKGVPTSCFGETEYFVNGVRVIGP